MMQQALNGRENVALQVEYMSTSHMEVSASYLTRLMNFGLISSSHFSSSSIIMPSPSIFWSFLYRNTQAVLGANMMMDHDIYFDSANRRLGVARATCSF